MTEIDVADLEITDDVLRQVQADWDNRVLRLKHPYVFDLIKVLAPYPQVSRRFALDTMWRTRKDAGLPIPRTFDNSVQASFQYYCRDSDEFKKRNAPEGDALFCWPKGKGAGVWALLAENARLWVRANRALLAGRILKT
jgi:hypothetical protein